MVILCYCLKFWNTQYFLLIKCLSSLLDPVLCWSPKLYASGLSVISPRNSLLEMREQMIGDKCSQEDCVRKWRKQSRDRVEAGHRCGFSWHQSQAEPMRSSAAWMVAHSSFSLGEMAGTWYCLSASHWLWLWLWVSSKAGIIFPYIFKLGDFNWWVGFLLRRYHYEFLAPTLWATGW